MESRDIYNLTRRQMEWEDNWIHVGTGNDKYLSLIKTEISNFFESQQTVHLKRGRRNSKSLQSDEVVDEIIELIDVENFELWSENFTSAIRFNTVGVMNKSKCSM